MTQAEIVAWWALGVAIFGVVATMPLTMLSHHYLPKVEDYFASRSREKLAKRIAKLQHRLDQLNDPKFFENLEWNLREHLFAVLYFLGAGWFVQAAALFLATGAVPGNWFWGPSVPHRNNLLTGITIAFFLGGVMLAGLNMNRSAILKPSKRPKLKLAIQAQIDALKVKLGGFDTQPPA